MRVNPELVKLARERLASVACRLLEKRSFVPMGAEGAAGAPGTNPAMGGAAPATAGMDPAAAGGGEGMDPAAAGGGGGMDPSAMGGAPPAAAGQDPAAGMPPLQVNLNDLVQLMSMVGSGQMGAPAQGAPVAGPEGAAPAGKKKKLPEEAGGGDQVNTVLLQQLSGKLDNLTALFNQVLGAMGQMGSGPAPEAGMEAAGPDSEEVASIGQGEQVSPETMGEGGPMGGQLTGPMAGAAGALPAGLPPGMSPGMPSGMPAGMSPDMLAGQPGLTPQASLARSAKVHALNRIISRLTS